MVTTIGIDPHKATHTAVAIDGSEQVLAEITVAADRDQARSLDRPPLLRHADLGHCGFRALWRDIRVFWNGSVHPADHTRAIGSGRRRSWGVHGVPTEASTAGFQFRRRKWM